MKTLNKQPYTAPSVKSVSFTVESGFAGSEKEFTPKQGENQLSDYGNIIDESATETDYRSVFH